MYKVLHLSHSDIKGGAARAAYRIHSALRSSCIDSRMLVNDAASGDWTVQGPTNNYVKALIRIRPYLTIPFRQLLGTANTTMHSLSILPSRWPTRINASDADLVNLHWVQREMISIADIGRINKPVVWTMHDMWPFCGAEHVTHDHRWRDGYLSDNRPYYESGLDLNRFIWNRKRKHWHRPIHVVCPSHSMSNYVRTSELMHQWPVSVVPHPIDTLVWQPIEKRLARQLFGLPQNCPLLLFGAMSGSHDKNKGFDLLLTALSQLRSIPSLQHLQLVVFGQRAPRSGTLLDFPIHYAGYLHDDLTLRVLYSAADLMIVPSRHESFGQTASEAHACGTPVVAFNTGGLADVVDDRVTGVLAKPFEPASLAASICWALEDSSRLYCMGLAARERAESLWSPNRVAAMYSEVYERAISQ